MQKKLIALAVAGLASAGAFAQSNVTVYGVADMYVGSFKTDGMERSTQVNSGGLATSRIGFKGVEDLGNGLKALFTMEYALALDNADNNGNGSGIGQARQGFVGLTGGFGTAVAGRLQTAGYDWQGKTDVLHGTAIDPLNAVQAGGFLIGSGSGALGARANNAIAYISPSFSGVTVALNRGYLQETTGVKDLENNQIANLVGVSYEAGPLYVGAVYANLDAQALGATAADRTDWALGAGYDFKVVKVTAGFQKSKDKQISDDSNTAWSLGAAVPVSAAGTIHASFAKSTLKNNAAGDTDEVGIKSWTLAYTHGLSKRTTAYAGYHQVNRDDNIAVPAGADVGAKTQAFVAGVNHKF
ncbi:porin [Azonexus sp.]|uniref:porin n=1 Tax=Azonexus sp. TaxID=1872668 RepID=UPI0035B43D43